MRIITFIRSGNFFKRLFIVIGLLSFILLALSFTPIPYYAYHWLGTSNAKLQGKPDTIVVLGGCGMPSPDGLIRTYYAAEVAKKFADAKIIIALPENEHDSLHQLALMAHELVVRGIDSLRIMYEPYGFNTHSQAANIAKMCEATNNTMSLLLVTSPEHMYRSVKTFHKAGFAKVGGIPTFEIPIDEELIKDNENSDDTRVKNLALRYNMWSYLNYELVVMREYTALCYYKVKGWI